MFVSDVYMINIYHSIYVYIPLYHTYECEDTKRER